MRPILVPSTARAAARGRPTQTAWLCSTCRVRAEQKVHRRLLSSTPIPRPSARRHGPPAASIHARRAGVQSKASYATMSEYRKEQYGPLAEYDARVNAGKLRNDEHQRNLIGALQDLHNMLSSYVAPPVVHPSIEELQPPKPRFWSGWFKSEEDQPLQPLPPKKLLPIPDTLPKGLYMYGDVGSGKTMLMDLFYDTLPANIKHKNRIHFHNFMQDVHKSLHKMRAKHGSEIDAIPFVAAEIASSATVLCFDEFQCTDVADAMILRRLIEALMHHGTVLVTTSNRHPSDLYKNGIQRDSFIPCINLLLSRLRVLNLDSTTDYRKIPRPPSGVYHHPLDTAAVSHADHWFRFLGDFEHDPPHPATQKVWGRPVSVPLASGKCARFTFGELIGAATGAADYLELMRSYSAFVVTDVPGMNFRTRDLARRFITFIDAVYESRAKLVLTCERPLTELFVSQDEIKDAGRTAGKSSASSGAESQELKPPASMTGPAGDEGSDLNDAMRMMMDDLGLNMKALRTTSIFSGDEEAFAFARALSRLSEMGSQDWIDRGLGLEKRGGKQEAEGWQRVRSRQLEDSM